MSDPIYIHEQLDETAHVHERLEWLRNTFGDRDPMMTRWKHHQRSKGQERRHWDVQSRNNMEGIRLYVYFGQKDMAVQYKLTWGGRLVG
jgi:hypothetical protein